MISSLEKTFSLFLEIRDCSKILVMIPAELRKMIRNYCRNLSKNFSKNYLQNKNYFIDYIKHFSEDSYISVSRKSFEYSS